MEQIKVSVIIPIYNQEKYLRECLDSVIHQTLQEMEILCVNDGSTDSSFAILSEYAWKDNRVKIINQNNGGVSVARNNAMHQATGEFISFLDGDDWYYDETVLETLYTKAKENNVLVCGGCFSENDVIKGERDHFLGYLSRYTFIKDGLYHYKDYQCDFGFVRFIYNRQFLLDNDFFFPVRKYFEDPVWFVKVMDKVETFYGIAKKTYGYRMGHKVREFDKESLLNAIQGMTETSQIAKRKGYSILLENNYYRITKDFANKLYPYISSADQDVMTLLNQFHALYVDVPDTIQAILLNVLKNKESTIERQTNHLNEYRQKVADSEHLEKQNKELNDTIATLQEENDKQAQTIVEKEETFKKQIEVTERIHEKVLHEMNVTYADTVNQLKNEINNYQKELEIAHNSYNWKVGKFILFIPKKIYYFFKRLLNS